MRIFDGWMNLFSKYSMFYAPTSLNTVPHAFGLDDCVSFVFNKALAGRESVNCRNIMPVLRGRLTCTPVTLGKIK